jgi:hypothetical protein
MQPFGFRYAGVRRHDGKLRFPTFCDAIKYGGVAEIRHLPRYRAFPGALNTICMTALLEKHDALYMATSA